MTRKNVTKKRIFAMLLCTLIMVTAIMPLTVSAATTTYTDYLQTFDTDVASISGSGTMSGWDPVMSYEVNSGTKEGVATMAYATEGGRLKLTTKGLPNSTYGNIKITPRYNDIVDCSDGGKLAFEFDLEMEALPTGIDNLSTNYFVYFRDSAGVVLGRLTFHGKAIFLGEPAKALNTENTTLVNAHVATNVPGSGTKHIKVVFDFGAGTYTAYCDGEQAKYYAASAWNTAVPESGYEGVAVRKMESSATNFKYLHFYNNYNFTGSSSSTADYNTYIDNFKVTKLVTPTYTTSITNGQKGVARNENISVNFSKAMDEASLSNIVLKNAATGTAVDVNRTLVNDGKTYILAPKAKLNGRTQYTLSVPATVKDTAELAVTASEVTFYTEQAEYADEYLLNFTGADAQITASGTYTYNTDVYMGIKTHSTDKTSYYIENNALKQIAHGLNEKTSATSASVTLNHRRNQIYNEGVVETSFTLKMDAFPEGITSLTNSYFIILRAYDYNKPTTNGYIIRIQLKDNRLYLGAPNTACVESNGTNVDAVLATNVAGRTEPMNITVRVDFDNQTVTAFCDGQQARYCEVNTADSALPAAYIGTATKAFEDASAKDLTETYFYTTHTATGSSTADYNTYIDDYAVSERKLPAAELIGGTELVSPGKVLKVNLNSAFNTVSGIELQDKDGVAIADCNGELSADGYTYKITPPVLTKNTPYKIYIPEQTDVYGKTLAETTIEFITADTDLAIVVSDYSITTTEGATVTALNVGDTINVSATFTLTGGSDSSNAALIVGVYNSENKLIRAFYDNNNSLTPANPTKALNVGFAVPEHTSYIKMFAWDTFKNCMPMVQAEQFPPASN